MIDQIILETPSPTKKKDYEYSLEFIDKSFKADGDLRISDLESESLKCPYLMNKYSTFLSLEQRFLGILNLEKDVLYRNLWLYYTGKAPAEVYQKKPFDLKILKSDLDFWINADDEMVGIKKKIINCEARISKLNNIVRNIQYRHSQIKNSIDEMKRKQGL